LLRASLTATFRALPGYFLEHRATLADMVDDNLEFYHDKTGLSLGKSSFITAIKNNICHKFKRELVVSTLEVFPLQDYGAIEVGHRDVQDVKNDAPSGR
jgi:Domain of unknown function (DUF4440)